MSPKGPETGSHNGTEEEVGAGTSPSQQGWLPGFDPERDEGQTHDQAQGQEPAAPPERDRPRLVAAKTVARPRGGRGYLRIENPLENEVREYDTLTCVHCSRVWVLNPERKRARGHCKHCNAYVCDLPVCQTECNPIQRDVELALRYAGTPRADQPFLARGRDGSVLYDPALKPERNY